MSTKTNSGSRRRSSDSIDVLKSLEKQTTIVSTKKDAKSDRWELELNDFGKEISTRWISSKVVSDCVNSRVENSKSQLCEYALEKISDKIFSLGCHPGNPNVFIKNDKGVVDHKFNLVMQDKFKLDVPKEIPEGENPTNFLRSYYIELLTSVGLSDEKATTLVDEELEIYPVTGVRSLTDLIDGHYGEKRIWIEATDEEREAGSRLAALLTWDGTGATPQPLTPEDKSLVVRRDNSVTVRAGFYSRCCQYVKSAEQLRNVFTVIKPVLFPSYAKFAIEDSEKDRVMRKIDAAKDILGE